VAQPVAASEGVEPQETIDNGGVCLGLASLVAEMKLERVKGIEPSFLSCPFDSDKSLY
jgi:hypothetical protein